MNRRRRGGGNGRQGHDGSDYADAIRRLEQIISRTDADSRFRELANHLEDDPKPFGANWLAFIRAGRDAGKLPPDVTLFLFNLAADRLADAKNRKDARLEAIAEEMRAIAEANGLTEDDDFAFPVGEGPPDYLALEARYDAIIDQNHAAALRDIGEADLADLYLADPEEFHRRSDRGRLSFMPPKDPGHILPDDDETATGDGGPAG